MASTAPLERAVQRSILAYLKLRGITVAHVPNGSVLAGDARARAIQVCTLKADGMRVGFPDLIVLHTKGRVGFLEVKREGGELGENQVHWAGCMDELGQLHAVVRSVEDVIETLGKWGWL
jgi:hypothetical protein